MGMDAMGGQGQAKQAVAVYGDRKIMLILRGAFVFSKVWVFL